MVAFRRLCGGMRSRNKKGASHLCVSLSGHRSHWLKHIDSMLASAELDSLEMENC